MDRPRGRTGRPGAEHPPTFSFRPRYTMPVRHPPCNGCRHVTTDPPRSPACTRGSRAGPCSARPIEPPLGIPKGDSLESGDHRRLVQLMVAVCFECRRRHMLERSEQAQVFVPVRPAQGGELDCLASAPRAAPAPAFAGMTDEFRLVRPDDGFGQSLPPSASIGGIAHAAHRGRDARPCEALGVARRESSMIWPSPPRRRCPGSARGRAPAPCFR